MDKLDECLEKLRNEIRKLPKDEIEYFIRTMENFEVHNGCPYCGNEKTYSSDAYGCDISTCYQCGGFFAHVELCLQGKVKLGVNKEEAAAAGTIDLDYNPFSMG